jgi:4-amino-4-deoxy-L-arabinose transferase-like glycosyltransferase
MERATRASRRRVVTLALLTLMAGALRTAWPSRPEVWNDEAMTFRRVSGTWWELCEELRDDGFVPLHYEMTWAVARVIGGPEKLTPFWLRLFPAACGTLMVPAMYWLGRELAGRRVGTLAATFSAVSAYLCAHSRDAKMYMPVWVFVTLNMGCFVSWLRGWQLRMFLLWAFTGVAMGGLHATGLILVGVEAVLLAAWWVRCGEAGGVRAVLSITAFVAGAGVILLGPAVHYLTFNRWLGDVRQRGWERASGLGWIAGANAGRPAWALAGSVGSAYLSGWEWPPDGARVPPAARAALGTGVAGSGVACLVGLAGIMRGRWRRGRGFGPEWGAFVVLTWVALPLAGFLVVRGWLWSARYLAVLWPAFAIGVCWLLLQIPWSAVRCYAVGLLLALNLANTVARVALQTEPPVRRMAADLSRDLDDPATAAYFWPFEPSYGPGGGSIQNHTGKYYLSLRRGVFLTPREFYRLPLDSYLPVRTGFGASQIAAELRVETGVTRLIVWERGTGDEGLGQRLGQIWRIVGDERFHVRHSWTWSELRGVRRREFVRRV